MCPRDVSVQEDVLENIQTMMGTILTKTRSHPCVHTYVFIYVYSRFIDVSACMGHPKMTLPY